MRTIITEGQATQALETHFNLTAPVAFEDVKRRYRKESKRLHPDLGGSEEKFKALSNAFDGLKQLYQLGSRLFDAELLEETADGESRPPPMPRETVDRGSTETALLFANHLLRSRANRAYHRHQGLKQTFLHLTV